MHVGMYATPLHKCSYGGQKFNRFAIGVLSTPVAEKLNGPSWINFPHWIPDLMKQYYWFAIGAPTTPVPEKLNRPSWIHFPIWIQDLRKQCHWFTIGASFTPVAEKFNELSWIHFPIWIQDLLRNVINLALARPSHRWRKKRSPWIWRKKPSNSRSLQ